MIRLAREIWSDKARMLAFAAACLALIFLVIQSFREGGFFDEFATLWYSDPTLSLSDTYADKWRYETNPPLFYLLVYGIRAIHEVDLEGLRLINALGYAFAVGYLGFLTLSSEKPSRLRNFALAALVLFVSSRVGVHYFAELRAYYLLFSVCVVFCVSLSCLVLALSANRSLDQILCFVSSLVLMNVHFMSAALTGMLLSATIVYCLLSRERRLAGFLAICLIVGALPEVAFIAANSSFLSARAGDFWISTSETQALRDVAHSVLAALSRNIVLVSLLATPVLGWVSKTATSQGKHRFDLSFLGSSDLAHIRFALLLIVATCGFFSILLIANLHRPIVIPRYLVPATAAMLAAISLVAADVLSKRPWYLTLFLANGILAVALNGVSAIKAPPQETDGGALIARLASACPDTIVHGIWNGRNMRGPYPLEYRYAARRYGITIDLHPAAKSWTPKRSADCPTLLWVVHWPPHLNTGSGADFLNAYFVRLPDLSGDLQEGQGAQGAANIRYLEPSGGGRILILPPLMGNRGG